MNRTFTGLAALVLLAGAVPFVCLLLPAAPASVTGVETQPAATATPSPAAPTSAADEPTEITETTADPIAALAAAPVYLYDEAAGAVAEVAARDFLIGAAACEMPPDWPDDALCAQMVASHSYALYCRDHGGSDEAGWLAVNSALGSGWTDEAALRARWGEDFDKHYARFEALADEVAGSLLLYDGAPALACYHAISNGRTEASEALWPEALPYLAGVDSAWDREADGFEVTIQLSAQQMADALAALGATPEGEPEDWVGGSRWDKAGYVESIELGGVSVRGSDLRAALGLRSACFAIAWRGGQFVITTRGYGHGIGLSQAGARSMAAGGANWQEILGYYFPGAEVVG